MKPTNPIYLGDHSLEPPDDEPDDDGITDAERRQKAFDDFDPIDEFGE